MTWVLHGPALLLVAWTGWSSSLHGPVFLLVPTAFPPGGFAILRLDSLSLACYPQLLAPHAIRGRKLGVSSPLSALLCLCPWCVCVRVRACMRVPLVLDQYTIPIHPTTPGKPETGSYVHGIYNIKRTK